MERPGCTNVGSFSQPFIDTTWQPLAH